MAEVSRISGKEHRLSGTKELCRVLLEGLGAGIRIC